MVKQKKLFKILNLISLYEWYNNIKSKDNNPLSGLPIQVQWAIKRDIDFITSSVKNVYDIRNDYYKKLQKEFKDKTYEEEGNTYVKEEYIEEYDKFINSLNGQLNEILQQEEEIEIFPLNIDAIVESLDEKNNGLTVDDLTMLEVLEVN